jgi:cytochrome b6-f complex iron-sulfur subunit
MSFNIATGPLASNGGFIVQNGILVARTNTGTFLAVASTCTHQQYTLTYSAGYNNFLCLNHGSQFDSNGNVASGPATIPIKKYNTSLSGNTLTVTGG